MRDKYGNIVQRYLYANGRPLRMDNPSHYQNPSYYLRYNARGDATFVPKDGNGGTGWRAFGAWGEVNYGADIKGYYNWNAAWGYMQFPVTLNIALHDAMDMGLYYAHGRWYNQDTGLWLSPNDKGDYLYGGDGQDPVNVGMVDEGICDWIRIPFLCPDPTPTPTPVPPAPPSPSPSPLPSAIPSGTWTPIQVLKTHTPTATLPPATFGTPEYELAKMMYYEERCRPAECRDAMKAVGWIAMNRINQPRNDESGTMFPGTLLEVLNEKSQFQGYVDNKNEDPGIQVQNNDPKDPNRVAWGWAIADAPDIVARRGNDPTNGALWFGNGASIEAEMKSCWLTKDTYVNVAGTTLFYSYRYFRNCGTPSPTPR